MFMLILYTITYILSLHYFNRVSIFSRSMTRAEGTKESRSRVSERGFFLNMVACACVRACVRTCLVPGAARRYVAHVPYLPAQSYFARYSELNNCCRAALN